MIWSHKVALGLGCLALAATSAYAATVGQVLEARQKSYKQMGRAFKTISDNLKTDQPSVALIRANAPTIVTMSKRIPNWLPAGTGKESGVKTAALPAIWQQPAKFRQGSIDLNAAAIVLNDAAKSGDLNRIRAAAGGVGKTCKGCHETFREKE